ncbi:MAG TPA: hypothetical protein VNW97_10490 [Candidatus Saccharimonadales bacterium]|jgi:hypothetical protein|nr:hypothetical protein [Candidatus Saccharimonadales bacterium]
MSRTAKTQSIVQETVKQVLDSALPRLREEMVARILQELHVLEPASGGAPIELLNAASSAIQESSSQADILRNLLEGAARFAGRTALFVIKAGSGAGWQATGFENNDAIRNFTLSASSGVLGNAVQSRAEVYCPVTDFDGELARTMGMPLDGQCLLLPLVVRDKVAAVLYVDAGTLPEGRIAGDALLALSRFTGVWLELTAMRRSAGGTVPEEPPPAVVAAPEPPPAPAGQALAPSVVEPEDELHRKARRFAKLLVDEIKLYNQAKVSEGRQNRDLYGRLREDIEKSRATYEKRYGESPAGPSNYFSQELVRILADNDATLMGAGFPG